MSTNNTSSSTASVSTLQAKYTALKAEWDGRNLFSKSWALAHMSVDASFEAAFLTLVWIQVLNHTLSQVAIEAADSADAGLYFWHRQNNRWRAEIAKDKEGIESQPVQLSLF